MKTKLAILSLVTLTFVQDRFAWSDEVTAVSTAIIKDFQTACASKSADTDSLIAQVLKNIPVIEGQISQKSLVVSATITSDCYRCSDQKSFCIDFSVNGASRRQRSP